MLRASLNVLLRLVSTKFWKKITFVDDVSELWPHIPPAQLALPNYVLAYNYKSFPLPPIFGATCLSQVLEIEHRAPDDLPRVLADATVYLRDHMRTEGLFRQCGEDSVMKKLIVQYNMGSSSCLSQGSGTESHLSPSSLRRTPYRHGPH